MRTEIMYRIEEAEDSENPKRFNFIDDCYDLDEAKDHIFDLRTENPSEIYRMSKLTVKTETEVLDY